MPALPDGLRRLLEKVVVDARDVGETGARGAFERLAVHRREPYPEMPPEDRELRIRLRAHARQLGDVRKENGEQEIGHLVTEGAYEHWHRMLFARFLAENQLLMHPEHGVPVTLAECEELALQAGENDGWKLAGRFASRMLPAIFRPDDPVLAVRLAPEHQHALEKLLAGLPAEVFTADDSLGWVYQFWQMKRKKEVNESGKKIGADELPAVTQLFTEPYMVQFLLHNTLGAWWAGKVLGAKPDLALAAESEEELRRACALPGHEWTYLRFVRPDGESLWRPAAGTFEGWPQRAAEITLLDPCCGSGHFLVEAFRILVPMRMVEENLSAQAASEAVLKNNLFGLEIDERCTQIAAFNLALRAWTYPGAGGYRALPEVNIACSGLAVGGKVEEWLKLAGKDSRLREGMRRLYQLFKDAPILGSLIDPRREEAELFKAGFEELHPLLEQVLAGEELKRDARVLEAGAAAQGMASAAALLAGSYTMIATNVPYLGRGKQHDRLRSHLEEHSSEGMANLATGFVQRSLDLCGKAGTVALVTPENWLYQTSYYKLRAGLLRNRTWNAVARLGPKAFQTPMWDFSIQLVILSASKPRDTHDFAGIDASAVKLPTEKSALLRGASSVRIGLLPQADQLNNPDAAITLARRLAVKLLADYADVHVGFQNGDTPRWVQLFWEQRGFVKGWEEFHATPERAGHFEGLHSALKWDDGKGELASSEQVFVKGREAWGKRGVLCRQTRPWPTSQYLGTLYDQSSSVLIPKSREVLAPLYCYLSSCDFRSDMRSIANALKFTNSTFVKVPFDLAHWQTVASQKYPNGLLEPESDDPTQWVFHGRPQASPMPLQVAAARLVGYRWPAELDKEMRLSQRARDLVSSCSELLNLADDDGIVGIPPVGGEQPGADRVQKMLAASFGSTWSPAALSALLESAGFGGKTLEDWLRDGFFEQHCQLFHQRPFVWHIWDGRKRDGFAAFVNYHKLDRKLLERLTYAVLGDWISAQRQGVKAGERGADERLAAAEALQKTLALIIEGEPPYDIFVRWKALHEQAIGWERDLNDGVRMNIRPFVEAGVLRKNPKIKWMKDRGKEPESLRPRADFPWFWKDGQFTGERVNDVHLTNAEKRAARERAGRSKGGAR